MKTAETLPQHVWIPCSAIDKEDNRRESMMKTDLQGKYP